MTTIDLDDEGAAPKRKWIPRETWRQEKAVVFVKHAVKQPHEFFAFDRTERTNDSHLWESRRGVKRGCPDTLLVTPQVNLWWEWKAIGSKVKEDSDQDRMLSRLNLLGDVAAWGTTIHALWRFYRDNGVLMENNAEYQAIHYDGLTDSRIAKAEAKAAGVAPAKKARARKAPPRFGAGIRLRKKMNANQWG